ncbi:hypothetical protein M405DRAFT_855068 [Rhizopogon salebrosus TDB-379]|nr:hypothetical protein M405DRAFT_855068 [Rhizopogon salebrosus TDB-379]
MFLLNRRRQRPQFDVEALARSAVLPMITETMEFVLALKQASLEDPCAKMSDDALERLRNPPRGPINIDSPGIRHSISMYLALEHASRDAYNRICRSMKQNFAGTDGVEDILSFHAAEKLVAAHTGVEPITHDMCLQSCLAYTGPYAELEHCPMCGTSRWDQARLQASNGRTKVAAQKFSTIPLAPQLQALYRNPDSARDMHYLHERTQEVLAELIATATIPVIDDIVMGWDYLTAVIDGDIKEGDIALMVSLDGAQLYESKQSDCWIYMWVILNLSPDKRYRKVHVRPGGFIPGPNKPKNVDSFLFVGMHHLAAIQNEGLTIWDASRDAIFISDLHLIFTTADGPGLVYWDGMVGHSGKNGCRIYCGVKGRRKTRGTRYYPALFKPTDRSVIGSDHPDIDVFKLPLGGSDDYETNLQRLVTSPNQRQLDIRKTETGVTKPPLILGLSPSRCLGVPFCMTTDTMHLAANLSDLLIALWRGTLDCGPSDDVDTWDWAVLRDEDTWTAHGKAVENAGPYLPASFDRKPCNISEKLNTSYKTWEFQLYTFGLAPALLYNILPQKYWVNYCQLVRGFQLMCQHQITAQELVHAQALLCSWEREFELLYYHRREDRIHFIRPCVHQTNHLVSETIRKGPSICYAQWTMERTIGNLGQEIRQPSSPFANLSQEGVRRCRVNTLLSIMPELDDPPKGLPTGSVDLGDGFVLLRKRERYASLPDGEDARAITDFLGAGQLLPRIKKWARLLLPNKQIVRSAWRETVTAREQVRMSRNVKFKLTGQFRFGEVLYFTRLAVEVNNAKGDGDDEDNWRFLDVAMIQMYSLPDEALLQLSSQTVASCTCSDRVLAIDVKDIVSVIAMVPHKPTLPSGVTEERFFMMEKPGLDVSDLGVRYSAYRDDDDDDDDSDPRVE